MLITDSATRAPGSVWLGALLWVAACGSSTSPSGPRDQAPPAPAAPVAEPPRVAPPPPLTLPIKIAHGGEVPAPGTAQRAVIDRWASEVGYLDAHVGVTGFRAEVTEITLLGAERVIRLQGDDGAGMGGSGGAMHAIERDGTIGPTLRFPIWDGGGWLRGFGACGPGEPHEPSLFEPLEGCDDLEPAVAHALLAHADAGDPVAAVRRAIGEIVAISQPGTEFAFIERARDLTGGARRHFVPLTATRDAAGLSASGTLIVFRPCVSSTTATFELRVEGDHVSLSRTVITEEASRGCI